MFLRELQYRGYTTITITLQFAKYSTEISHNSSETVLWTDETKINLYQSEGKANVWRKKGSAYDPKHASSSVKYGGGSVMAWASMAASGVGSLIFIDDVTHDGKVNWLQA